VKERALPHTPSGWQTPASPSRWRSNSDAREGSSVPLIAATEARVSAHRRRALAARERALGVDLVSLLM
jgi:hypothetical protein